MEGRFCSISTASRRAKYCASTTRVLHLPAPTATAGSLASDATPALLLDVTEEQRVSLTNAELISEALAASSSLLPKTRDRYRDHLDHWDTYLATAHSRRIVEAEKRHVDQFMTHLASPGGSKPDDSRLRCAWCRERGYPDGKSGQGWSASYRKSYLSALRFLYDHATHEGYLDRDPTARVKTPRVAIVRQYTPSVEEVQRFLDAPGRPRDRLLAYWAYYAPSRRQTFADAKWQDIEGLDTDQATWRLVGKNRKADGFPLHPLLRSEFRRYRAWQMKEAERNPDLRAALSYPDTAYVLLTRTGRPLTGQTVAKLIKWRALRARVGVYRTKATYDCPQGLTSRLTPHALRRAWADHALNDPIDPTPIDVVADVLDHKHNTTTRRNTPPTTP
jgi:integrase